MGAARCMRALGGLGTRGVWGEQWRPLAGVGASRCAGIYVEPIPASEKQEKNKENYPIKLIYEK